MRRRPFIATALSTGTGLLAGCLGSSTGSPDSTTTAASTDVGCPSFDGRVETVVCTPDLDDPDSQMAMQPASATGSLPMTSIEFTLANDRDSVFNTNFYAWRLQKYVDGEWYHVVPQAWPEPLMRIDPGGSHAWTLTVHNADLEESIPPVQGTEDLTVVGLGGGTYAFGATGWFEGEDTDAQTAFVTRFSLDGPQLDLSPTPDVEERVRQGDKVLVSWPKEQGDPLTYRLTRLKEVPAEADRLIPEQVIRTDPFRNGLALFEQWSRIVEVETTTAAFEFGVPESRTFVYEGTAYRYEVV